MAAMIQALRTGILLILLTAGLCSDFSSPPESVWQGILLSKAGRDRYPVRIELAGLSSEKEIDKLDHYRRIFDFPTFLAELEGGFKGVVRVSKSKVIPIRVALRQAVGQGWRYLLVAKNGVAEPGVGKVLASDRFMVIELILDGSLSGQGKIYEDADVDFAESGVRLASTKTIPRTILSLKAVEKTVEGDETAAKSVENL